MNIPLELVDVLKWRENATNEEKPFTKAPEIESFVDHFLSVIHPIYDHMIQFGLDYHNFMDKNDQSGLLDFIDKYKNDSYWRLAKFANGLQMDIEAVTNTLLYPDISNGPVEGINNLVKCVKRVCGGKAKVDLLTAKIVVLHIKKAVIGIGKKIIGAIGDTS
jgi:transposase